jgi:nitrogen regulatory protein P-II 1
MIVTKVIFYSDMGILFSKNRGGEKVQKIKAIIRPHRFDEVKTALVNAGVIGMTVGEIKGLGRQKSSTEVYRGVMQTIEFDLKLFVEIVVPDDQVDALVETLVKSAQTGEIGDGKIFISPIESVVRIRTTETNLEAL